MNVIMPILFWFTDDEGEICLGTKASVLAPIVFATGVTATAPFQRKLTDMETATMSAVLGEFNQWSADGVASFAAKVG
tara:strand:- start:940 stop:1173 length:234 start_codon:yes stop_codon:yes gene_type:complete